MAKVEIEYNGLGEEKILIDGKDIVKTGRVIGACLFMSADAPAVLTVKLIPDSVTVFGKEVKIIEVKPNDEDKKGE